MRYRIQYKNGAYRVQSNSEGWLMDWVRGEDSWLTRNVLPIHDYNDAYFRLQQVREDDAFESKPWTTVYDHTTGVRFYLPQEPSETW